MKKTTKKQQCHNLCSNDYKASSTTELLLKVRRCNDSLNSMPPFSVWNDSWTVMRHGNKTSNGEGKVKFENKF